MTTRVSCVVVNYNGRAFLADCLRSVQAQHRPFDEVVVVDNASGDSSADLVAGVFPGAKLLRLDRNIGYAAGCNVGIEATSGDLTAVFNNDVVLDAGWLASMLEHDRKPWDFWASRILFRGEPVRIDSAGDGMAVVGAGYKIGHGDPADRYVEPREVFGPCAAAALYRRSLLRAVGGFDPDYFLVYEDSDLNMRARLLGYRCMYVPGALVHHQVNASIGAFSRTYVFYGHRNSEFLFWKCMPSSLLLRYLPERVLFDLASFLFFLCKGRGGAFVLAKLDFLRSLPGLAQKRSRVQKGRRLTPSELRRLLDRNWLRYRRKALVRA